MGLERSEGRGGAEGGREGARSFLSGSEGAELPYEWDDLARHSLDLIVGAGSKADHLDSSGSGTDKLPIQDRTSDILNGLAKNNVALVETETGGGKTTWLPRMLSEAGYFPFCCGPTRLLAESAQQHVESQIGAGSGTISVSYMHGRGNNLGETPQVVYATHGVLAHLLRGEDLKKIAGDKTIVIMVDEVHTFSLEVESILFTYKRLLEQGEKVKLICASATMNAPELARYLGLSNHDIFKISGRNFQIYDQQTQGDPIDDILSFLKRSDQGHVLVFYPGEREILDMQQRLLQISNLPKDVDVIAIHGKLPMSEQMLVHQENDRTKIILATDIVGTGITIKDVGLVIDLATRKILVETPHGDMLKIVPCSKTDQQQRRGRTGRTRDGIYITHSNPAFGAPDSYYPIQYAPLHGMFLKMVCAGEDPLTADFLHSPDTKGNTRRLATMNWLAKRQFVEVDTESNRYVATDKGQFCGQLPLSPREAEILWHAWTNKSDIVPALRERLIDVVAILNTRDFRIRSESDIFRLVDRELHNFMRKAEVVANLCALVTILSCPEDQQMPLFKEYGIRPDAAQEVIAQRVDIGARLGFKEIQPLGELDLIADFDAKGIDIFWAALAQGYSDCIFKRHSYKDSRPLYKRVGHDTDIDSNDLVLFELSRYATIGAPEYVAGRPLLLGTKLNNQNPLFSERIIASPMVVPLD